MKAVRVFGVLLLRAVKKEGEEKKKGEEKGEKEGRVLCVLDCVDVLRSSFTFVRMSLKEY